MPDVFTAFLNKDDDDDDDDDPFHMWGPPAGGRGGVARTAFFPWSSS